MSYPVVGGVQGTLRPPLQRPTSYDIAQEQMRHDDAVHWFGEMTAFISWWRPQDFEAGLVGSCPTCQSRFGDGGDRILAAYGQPTAAKCSDCFGTTFEGGIRARYYRPAIWDLTPVEHDVKKRGEVEIIRGTIQTISNMHLFDADAAIRADGTRWRLDQPVWQEITTGFGSQQGRPSYRLQSRINIAREDEKSAPVFLVPVNFDALTLTGWLPWVPHSPHPLDIAPPEDQSTPWDGEFDLNFIEMEEE